MNHAEFDWDFENITHIGRHGVTPEEAESALSANTFEVDAREEGGEFRIMELGMTSAGRILFLAWTQRGELTRIVTALEPGATLKRQFLTGIGGYQR